MYSDDLAEYTRMDGLTKANPSCLYLSNGATSSLCKKLSFKEIPGNKEKLEGELTILFFTYPKDK